jgi:hypothetical protein
MGQQNKHRFTRRSMLQITGGLAVAGAAAGVVSAVNGDGANAAQTGTDASAADPSASASASASDERTFVHPGILHAYGELNRAKVRVKAGTKPWAAGWERLIANGRAQSTWTARPLATVIRGGDGQNYSQLYIDIHAAYQNALRWRIAGSRAHGDTARNILNAWSAQLTTLTGNADRFLAAGIYGFQFANAAELMRDYPGFEFARFKKMLLNVFHPLSEDFLTRHNDANIENYWANWDLCNMANIMATGILCDDTAKFDRAVEYFKAGAGNGSIGHAVPFLHPGGLAQWQESGRDQGHSLMGIGLMGAICEMAWSQGLDLYGYDDNRFMKAAQYVAKYNLGGDVPFTEYSWHMGQGNGRLQRHTAVSDSGRGQDRPVWELLHNHYARRRRLSVPYITAMAEKQRPEGGGGDYGPNSGGYDQLGFGTLLYSR